MMNIWAHTLVKNEERYIWYAVRSAIDLVDRILIWDTGSTDATVDIIQKIKKKYANKVDFQEIGEVDSYQLPEVRQNMLRQTKSDWILILDGDEVWWEASIKKVCEEIQKKGNKIESVVVKTINLIGDIYHYQEEEAGKYEFAGKKGHFNLRAISTKIPGLGVKGVYPLEYFSDTQGKPIQERQQGLSFLDVAYLHFTHLERSQALVKEVTGRARKFKYEIGKSFPSDFYYPEVFFRPKPKIVLSPWLKMDSSYLVRALAQTPFKKIKRRLNHGKINF